MGDQTTADNIISGQASRVTAEFKAVAQAASSSSITPSTIVAAAGLLKGLPNVFQVNPDMSSAMSNYNNAPFVKTISAATTAASANVITAGQMSGFTAWLANNAPSLGGVVPHSAAGKITSSTSLTGALSTQQTQLLGQGAATFTDAVQQAQGHVQTSLSIKSAMNFMSTIQPADMGTGISNMTNLASRGMDGSIGDLKTASSVMGKMGSAFDLNNMSSFGTPGGLVTGLLNNGAGAAGGLTDKLKTLGIGPDTINHPDFQADVSTALASVKDQTSINSIQNTLGVSGATNPFAGLPSAGSVNSLNSAAASLGLG